LVAAKPAKLGRHCHPWPNEKQGGQEDCYQGNVKKISRDAFPLEYTRHGNYKPGTDDKADALVIALAGHKIKSLDKVEEE
jgi:hypothetical protein